jgi:hypothetical protein
MSCGVYNILIFHLLSCYLFNYKSLEKTKPKFLCKNTHYKYRYSYKKEHQRKPKQKKNQKMKKWKSYTNGIKLKLHWSRPKILIFYYVFLQYLLPKVIFWYVYHIISQNLGEVAFFHKTYYSFITSTNSQIYENCKHFHHTSTLYNIIYFHDAIQI